jgi:hypothetical protein
MTVTPTSDFAQAFQAEQGRIRMGMKDPKRGMKALNNFRFTSPDKESIEWLAETYGGTARKWSDPKASPKDQWEVLSKASSIDVWVPPGGLSIWYEIWSGGGRERYCDGVDATVVKRNGEEQVPCICLEKGKRQCDVITRMRLLIVGTPNFAGTWRLQTKSEAAARELPGIEAMMAMVQVDQPLPATLSIEQRQSSGGSKKYVVPKLTVKASLEEMAQLNSTGITAIASAGGEPLQIEEPADPIEEVTAARVWENRTDIPAGITVRKTDQGYEEVL